jgi:hypothetical protein
MSRSSSRLAGDAITFCVILNMTFAAVVFSIVVHGLTIHRMFTKD